MSASKAPIVPQAPHGDASSPVAPAASDPTPRSFSRPTTANNAAYATPHDATNPAPGVPTTALTTAPTTAPIPTAAAAQATPTVERLSYNDKLNASDRYWKFKIGLQAILIITGLIGIGCFGWIITSRSGDGSYYSWDFWSIWPSLLTWTVSIIWVTICILVFLLHKRPVHPGLRVAIDLILWLSFIITAMLALLALRSTLDWGVYGGPDGWMYDYSYNSNGGGDYVLATNNTWVWEQDDSYVSSPRNCTGRRSLYSDHDFANCEEQDAYVNKLWAEKPHRVNVEYTAVVCQFFGLVLHFALFVWACVDTHRRRRGKVGKDAEKLAAGIVQKMIENGTMVPQSQALQYPPQAMYAQHSMGQQGMGMQQGQYPMAMGQPGMGMAAAGPSGEKSTGARYA
ncbi:hypothetical protein GMOD_00000534 [Pyrenophora seminiperda CCB06]|uniref:MARVEL domain-containing protein n=1 Tax=Pyrenophora seminiperda CCB06 TaxID=1302712 RepID=A0A3M7M7H1_9PLEO|nr:hypothetical protein GMOD_00000534 [Pyrenophora seminiperda CCB06]